MEFETKDLIMYGITALMFAVILFGSKNILFLKRGGKKIRSKVLKKEEVRRRSGVTYYITHEFCVHGAPYQSRVPVGKRLFDSHEEEGEVVVLFSPLKPGVNIIEADMARTLKGYVLIVAFFSFCCAWYFFGWNFDPLFEKLHWEKTIEFNAKNMGDYR